MDDVTRHPDDSTLFDLVEGTLPPANAELVQAHLSRCAACAAFVRAARVGVEATSGAAETMPEQSAAALHAAVTEAWRERVSGIAAAEAAEDAAASAGAGAGGFAGFAPGAAVEGAAAGDLDVEPMDPDATVVVRPARRRRSRRLVPVLAFVVLGALAGTSIYIGEQPGDGGGSADERSAAQDSDTESNAPASAPEASVTSPDMATDPVTGEPIEPPAAAAGGAAAGAPQAATAPEPGVPALEGGEDVSGEDVGGDDAEPALGASGSTNASADAQEAAKSQERDAATATSGDVTSTPPADYDEFVGQEQVCIATLDETALVLPDGRLPMQITQGPFGLYLVCG